MTAGSVATGADGLHREEKGGRFRKMKPLVASMALVPPVIGHPREGGTTCSPGPRALRSWRWKSKKLHGQDGVSRIDLLPRPSRHQGWFWAKAPLPTWPTGQPGQPGQPRACQALHLPAPSPPACSPACSTEPSKPHISGPAQAAQNRHSPIGGPRPQAASFPARLVSSGAPVKRRRCPPPRPEKHSL